jgi:hypothetical protein
MDKLNAELLKEIRKEQKEAREFYEACQNLERSPPFQMFRSVLQRMVEARGSSLLEPVQGVDGAMRQEFEKGTMKGLLLASNLVSVTIAAMQAQSAPNPDAED